MITKIVCPPDTKCNLCDRVVPPGVIALQKVENKRVLCILCLVEIAEIARSEQPRT